MELPKEYLYPSNKFAILGFWLFANIRKYLIIPKDKGIINKLTIKLKILKTICRIKTIRVKSCAEVAVVIDNRTDNMKVKKKTIPDSTTDAATDITPNNKVVITGLDQFPFNWDKALFFCSDIEIITIPLSKKFQIYINILNNKSKDLLK